jgi:SEC-C motif-containing protein
LKGKTPVCPCGGGAYAACCGRFLDGEHNAPDAQSLMRSRYSAYVLQRQDYVLDTWHASTRPSPPLFEEEIKWLGLEVRRHSQAGERAVVEFVARYRVGGQGQRLHEVSNFVREDGRWWYVDGSFPDKKK